jgi:hypothetical protein
MTLWPGGNDPHHGRVAGSRAEPGDVADTSGDPDGHGLELISITCPRLARSSRSSSSLKNPALKGTADAGPARHTVSPHLYPRCVPGPGGVLVPELEPVMGNCGPSPYYGKP